MMMMNMGGSGGSMGMDMMGMGSMGSMGSMGPGTMGSGMAPAQMMPYYQYPGMQGHYGPQGAVDMSAHGATGVHGAATTGLFGSDFTGLLTTLFNFAINIFAILLVVGLVVGVVVFIKRYLFDGNTNFATSATACAKCGQNLKAEWSCCPKCGEMKAQPVIQAPAQQTV